MSHVVAEPDRLHEVLVEAECTRHAARDPRCLERVRHSRPVVVAGRVDEDLRLPLQTSERFRVQDAVAIALERRAQPAFVLLAEASAGLVRPDGERRQGPFFVFAYAFLETVCDLAGELGHAT
jgi:hypothetical protein